MSITDHLEAPYGERIHFNKQLFEEQLDRFTAEAVQEFKGITRQYALFHICFFLLAIVELFAFVLFFSVLTKSTIFAFTLAGLFFTGFTYFVLHFYLQAKKPQQLMDLRSRFTEECKAALPFSPGESALHQTHANALYLLLSHLHRQEYKYYSLPSYFKTLAPLMQKFSAWAHWKDLHQMKEILLHLIIKEYIEVVKLQPTDLETHANLATAYLTLAKLYRDPRAIEPTEEYVWIAPAYHTATMMEKFKRAATRALDELRILDTYAPGDRWVHMQLAMLYHDLEMPELELKEYELLMKVAPQDVDVMQCLGTLCFEQGKTAHGLQIYDALKKLQPAKAEELLHHYGAFSEDYLAH